MLARFCLSQSQATTISALDQGLGSRIVYDCASLCVENASKIVDLVYENNKSNGITGVIQWWYRLFYLHIAGTIFIAAMLRSDLFKPAVSQSWSRMMSILRAHEHLSPYVQQSVATFETLAFKISESLNQGSGQPTTLDGSSNTYFQDIFQDMGFDHDNFLFGKEDMAWLSNIDSSQ